jgi:acyl dehydratase
LYRLSGDRNPLHADPDVAEAAGFSAPILHGLCTYGVACRSIIKEVCHYDSSLIKEFNVRFSSPVFPGERISTEIWVDGNEISFRSWVKDRKVMVINNGKCILRG